MDINKLLDKLKSPIVAKLIIFGGYTLYAISGIVLYLTGTFDTGNMLAYEFLGIMTTFIAYVFTFTNVEEETD